MSRFALFNLIAISESVSTGPYKPGENPDHGFPWISPCLDFHWGDKVCGQECKGGLEDIHKQTRLYKAYAHVEWRCNLVGKCAPVSPGYLSCFEGFPLNYECDCGTSCDESITKVQEATAEYDDTPIRHGWRCAGRDDPKFGNSEFGSCIPVDLDLFPNGCQGNGLVIRSDAPVKPTRKPVKSFRGPTAVNPTLDEFQYSGVGEYHVDEKKGGAASKGDSVKGGVLASMSSALQALVQVLSQLVNPKGRGSW